MSIIYSFLSRLKMPDAEEYEEDTVEEVEEYYNSDTTQYAPHIDTQRQNSGIIHHGLKDDLNAPFTALDERYQDDSESVQGSVQDAQKGVQNGVQSVQDSVQEGVESVQNLVHGQDWTHRASRNARKNRPVMGIATIVNIFMLTCLVILTYVGYPLDRLISGYVILFAVFLLTDPIQCFERFLANKTRWLISLTVILTLVALATENTRVYMAVGVMGSVFVFLSYACNRKWMIQETVETSIAMERAMSDDPDGNAQRAWNAYGWKQTLTMLHEFGFSIPREELLGWVACVYQLGFIHSQKKNAFGEKMKEKAQATIEKQERTIASLKEIYPQFDALQKQLAEKEREVELLKENIGKMEGQVKYYKSQFDAITEENKTLKATNEEILNSVGTSDEIISFEEEAGDREKERIYALLDAGKSIRDTAQILSIPKGRVEKAKKERKVEKAVNE